MEKDNNWLRCEFSASFEMALILQEVKENLFRQMPHGQDNLIKTQVFQIELKNRLNRRGIDLSDLNKLFFSVQFKVQEEFCLLQSGHYSLGIITLRS